MFRWFFPFLSPKIELGKKYVYVDREGSIKPFFYVPKKMNDKFVLCDCHFQDYPPNTESEINIRSFKAFYIPYEQ
jgi:hypothetical protein